MGWELLQGECEDHLRNYQDNTFDSVVTDPPYSYNFMGNSWDNLGGRFQGWNAQWGAEVLRVLKPGGYALVFGGARTYHRLACGLEDAGFEIRDCIMWVYGSGFPKSRDISKAIDKEAGVEREVAGPRIRLGDKKPYDWNEIAGASLGAPSAQRASITTPATDAAKQWEGWGTALKPAYEPILVCRKPFRGTVANNVLKHGTGGINIDGCRVAHGDDVDLSAVYRQQHRHDGTENWRLKVGHEQPMYSPEGRWPPDLLLSHMPDCVMTGSKKVKGITGGTGHHKNTIYGKLSYDEGAPVKDYADADGMETVAAYDCAPGCPVAEMDRQSGISKSTIDRNLYGGDTGSWFAGSEHRRKSRGDSGGASRFFPAFLYHAKAKPSERPCVDGIKHPTVKPVELIRWLVRLVTPEGGTVLDPFAGSGTTAEACEMEGLNSLVIEREPKYVRLIAERMGKYAEEAAA